MGRTLDRTKTTNKKCEHCRHWSSGICTSTNSKHFRGMTNYWIRCDAFEWEDAGTADKDKTALLKQFLKSMRKNAESFQNNDYHTGYVSAVSTIEGFIACCEIGGAE